MDFIDRNYVYKRGKRIEGLDPQQYLRENKERDFYVLKYKAEKGIATIRKTLPVLKKILPQLKKGISCKDIIPIKMLKNNTTLQIY